MRASLVVAALFMAWTVRILSFVPKGALAATITNPQYLWVTVSNGTKITLAQFVDGIARPVIAFGTTCNATTIQSALNQGANILLPVGTCDLSTTGLTMAQFSQLVGQGAEQSILTYSGTACAITRDSVQGTLLQEFRLNVSGSSATKRGLCDANTTGNNLRNVARNVQIWGDTNNPRTAGTYGIYCHSTTSNSLYYNEFDHVDLNFWDISSENVGDVGSGGCNAQKYFAPESSAANTGLEFKTVANDNQVYGLHCNGGGYAGAQTCVAIGDAATNTTGNQIHFTSDQGANGKGYAIAAASLANMIFETNESTLASTDGNASATTTNWIFQNKAGTLLMKLGALQIGPATISTANSAGLTVKGAVADGASAVALTFSNNAAFSNAAALLGQWKNGSTVVRKDDLNGATAYTGVTFANIATGSTANGTVQYCSDCTIANPCAGGGTGAIAKRLAATWICN